jgi:hypothetical protein
VSLKASAVNTTEGRRMLANLDTKLPSPAEYLHQLFYIQVVHCFGFFGRPRGEELSTHELKLSVGFVLLSLQLFRPATRANVFASMENGLVQEQLLKTEPGETEFITCVTKHKTHVSYGALLLLLPPLAGQILKHYVGFVRRRAAASFDFETDEHLFPVAAPDFMAYFLKSCGLPSPPTASQIRSWFADVVSTLRSDSEWQGQVDNLVTTFAHQSPMVVRHYHLSVKAENERTLNKLVSVKFLEPARRRALSTLGLPTFPTFRLAVSASPAHLQGALTRKPTSRKRPASFLPPVADQCPSPSALPAVAPCRNIQRKKGCLAAGAESKMSAGAHNCDACVAGYGSNGNFTAKRQKKYQAKVEWAKLQSQD